MNGPAKEERSPSEDSLTLSRMRSRENTPCHEVSSPGLGEDFSYRFAEVDIRIFEIRYFPFVRIEPQLRQHRLNGTMARSSSINYLLPKRIGFPKQQLTLQATYKIEWLEGIDLTRFDDARCEGRQAL